MTLTFKINHRLEPDVFTQCLSVAGNVALLFEF